MGRKNRSNSGSRQRHRSRSQDRHRQKQRKRNRSRERERSRSKQYHREQKKRNKFSDGPAQDFKVASQASQLTSKLSQNLYGAKDNIKGLSLMQKLNPSNKNLGLGYTLVEGSSSFPLGNINTSMFSMMTDANKIKRKIILPKDSNFNYTGLLIGPKGNSQKQLEQKTGCKILVRGKGSQNQTNDFEDNEDLHVLILGENQAQVAKACAQIQRIIFADDDTLNKMKQEQMVQYQQGIAGDDNTYNLSLTTPYGPPSESAYILQVPNQCVGLVIGKQGQTIKNIAKRSGAIKVQVATSSAPNSKSRNIFVQGDYQSVQRVRKQLNTIVETQKKMNNGAVSGSHIIQVQVPVRLIGLVIGKGGQTIKGINARTGAFVCLKKDQVSRRNKKVLTITGTEDLCLIAKYEIQKIIQKGLINLQNTGGLTPDEAEMVKPLTPIAMQLAQANIPIPTQVQTIQQDPTTQYVLNKTLQNHIPTDQLFQNFLGSTKSVIQQTIIEEGKSAKKKFVRKF